MTSRGGHVGAPKQETAALLVSQTNRTQGTELYLSGVRLNSSCNLEANWSFLLSCVMKLLCLVIFSQSLASPRKLIQPNRLSPHTAASTPKRSPASIRRSKLASSSSPVIGTPDEKPKPPNGLIRRDSYEQGGSDSEMDEPFFNFDSEDMDDEELYCESLLDELKRQQVCEQIPL